MASRDNLAAGAVSLFEKREELHRVLESKQFANSPKKSRFLEFVAEQTFLGNGDKLNEYLIGVEVYERGTEFDPQTDPIVRVQAHDIRRALKHYYEGEGRSDSLRLELPVGGYVPTFVKVAPGEPTTAPERPPAQLYEKRARAAAILIASLSTVCLLLGALLVREWTRNKELAQHSVPVLSENLQWFWKPFLPPAEAPMIVIPNHPILRAAHGGDSPQTLSRGHMIPKDELPEFRDTIHFRELKQFVFVPSITDFTAVGETMGLANLFALFAQTGQIPRLLQSRLVTFEEIKRGNAILLGGNQTWSGRIYLYPEGFHFVAGTILNKNPRSGEQAVYKPEFDAVTNQLSRDYALVLMLPNERKENRILLIYGIYTQGSQAALEYVSSPERLAELRQALIDISPDHKSVPPYFQALLEAPVENSIPGKASLVSLRVIPSE
jgi:hypothetical protein